MIYHYCDAAAFISIVTNKKLWLTNTRKMNDHSEGAIIERAILKWLREDQERNDPPRYADNAASLIEEALAQNRPELYACCFSRERDSTTQWLNYADRGRGFAIGFREDLLHTNTLVPWNHSSFEGEKYVVPVRFSDNAGERLTLTPVLYVDDDAVSTIVAERLGLNIDAFIRTGDAAPMVNTATFFSSIAKDASFQHENELRLVYAPSVIPPPPGTVGEPHVIGDIKVLRWRASSYGVTPYFEFAFNTEAISEIWIGPANPEHKDYAARHLIATMLHLNCLWNVRLLESRSPYR